MTSWPTWSRLWDSLGHRAWGMGLGEEEGEGIGDWLINGKHFIKV
ncbi:hypothetical protein Dthio_PD2436 [Desulfonatronospira thiodismutans ASO3-1]|uniref:Uncharacterized protein n=1 Tax=Desulfonatronospira thiodismutans ASO3-1 TaxID=555779 RepID=D6SQL6_9BACT|nr:hypothetical protein Dthio_PD2436 [Desulfonatronospira thiodismutans ASO3-1]